RYALHLVPQLDELHREVVEHIREAARIRRIGVPHEHYSQLATTLSYSASVCCATLSQENLPAKLRPPSARRSLNPSSSARSSIAPAIAVGSLRGTMYASSPC